jgi:hypothetical protein
MDAGLVVVLAATGVFLLVPLAFAWLSTNPRRWARVEGVLGRDPRGSERWARWAAGFWVASGSVYIVMGVVRLRSDVPRLGWVWLVMGALYIAFGVAGYLLQDRVRRERSTQPQVEDRAEPRSPGAGG